MKKNQLLIVLVMLLSITYVYSQKRVLFVRGGNGSGGFLEGGSNEQLADINNFQTFNGNHGWGTLAQTLEDDGYTLTQVTEGSGGNSAVNFANLNLNQYDIIVLGSNNASYNSTQVNAVDNWVKDGGGLLTISDANFGSSWCDAPNSDQDFLDRYGIIVHQDLGTYSLQRNNSDFVMSNHPILEDVDRFDGEGVSPFIKASNVPAGVTVQRIVRAKNTIRLNNSNSGNCQGSTRSANGNDAVLMTATSGDGRVVAHFDRNTFFNQNGAGTNINRFDNKQYALNVFKWLSEAGGNSNPPVSQSPFGGSNASIPGVIQVENYDLGGQGVAYNDTTAGNTGGEYRNDRVDVNTTQDSGGGHKVGWIANGEWLEYTTNVVAGTYDIELRAASANPNAGNVKIELDGVDLGTIDVQQTNGWDSFVTYNLDNITISGGNDKVLRLSMIGGSFDLNFIEFIPVVVSNTQSAFGGSNATIPGTIEVENYDLGGQGVAYNDTTAGNTGGEYRNDRVDINTTQDSGGGHKVGWIANGEWLEYTTNVVAGTYDIELRAASANPNAGNVKIELDGVDLGTIDVEQTNGWDSFVTYNLDNITISGGNDKVLRLSMIGGSLDLNFIRFIEVSTSTDYPVISSFTGQQVPNVADNILDGNDADNSRWSVNGFPQSVVIDYGSLRNFTGSRLWTYQNRAYRYRIYVSNNPNSGFVEVVNRSGNNSTAQPITNDFSGVLGRYVRLTVTGAANYSGSWVSITELEMVSTSGLLRTAADTKLKVENEKVLKAYPNPSETGVFNLSEKRTWTVYNTLGMKIKTGNTKEVNLSQYSKGVYFLKTKNETKRLLIK